jgi:predicted P-loop ATPase
VADIEANNAMFDPVSWRPAQLMLFASCSKGMEHAYISGKNETSPLLSADEYLEKAKQTKTATDNRVEYTILDPREIRGVTGEFCKKYSIDEAIAKYLPDIYQKSNIPNRYNYIKPNGTPAEPNGLYVTDDKLCAFSHNTNADPVAKVVTRRGKPKYVNAFDLVRIHLYGHLDGEIDKKTPGNKRPSFGAMKQMASKENLTKEIKQEPGVLAKNDEWVKKLKMTFSGIVLPCDYNIELIMGNDPMVKGLMGLNEITQKIQLLRRPSWRKYNFGNTWTDADEAELRAYLGKQYDFRSKSIVADAITNAIHRNSFHPVLDYLENLPEWDGIPRVDTLLIDYMYAEDNELTRAITRKWLCGALKRITEPGCEFSHVLMIFGFQGMGKTFFLKELLKDDKWYGELRDLDGSAPVEQIIGSWLVEIAELKAFNKTDIETQKAFLSRSNDEIRLAYHKNVENYPRQCVFYATTNNSTPLKDTTGNRRWWPVACGVGKTKDYFSYEELMQRFKNFNRDQIWAEALYLFELGEELELSPELGKELIERHKQFTDVSDTVGKIEAFLDRRITKEWYNKSAYDRRVAYQDNSHEGEIARQKTCVVEILYEVFGVVEKDHAYKPLQNKIINLFESGEIEGWVKCDKGTRGRLRFGSIYGFQTAYVRAEIDENQFDNGIY